MKGSSAIVQYTSPFEPIDFVMIRAPLLPLDTLRSWLDVPLQGSTPSDTCDRASLAQGREGGHEFYIARDAIRNHFLDPRVQEAIWIGSPDLHRAVTAQQLVLDGKRGRRVQTNLRYYLTRMATRPTPFGLFAGVALGCIGGSEMDIRIGASERHRTRTRPDLQWLLHLVREMEQRPEVASHLRFFPNSVRFVSGGRLYFPHLDSYGQQGDEKTASVRATPVVARVLALASEGITLEALRALLATERPDATEEQILDLLDGLRQQTALLSDLRPPLTGDDPTRYLLRRIEGVPGCEEIARSLRSIIEMADSYDARPIGRGIPVLKDLFELMESRDADLHNALAVDMAIAVDGQNFSRTVAEEVARTAELMLRLSAVPPQFPHLAAYRREFIERYGEGREVPVLELLDENTGLGPPMTYQHPLRTGKHSPVSPGEYALRDRTLFSLATTALCKRQQEVELDEVTLSRLEIYDDWRDALPNSLDLYISIAAKSQEAIDRGDYSIVVEPRVGDQPLGRSFGRFGNLLGHEFVDVLTSFADEEERAQPERIFAELVYLPANGHAANIAVRPAIRHHEIAVAASPGVPYRNVIPVNDLVVGVHGDRFYLRSATRGAEVIATNTHLLNYSTAPNLCHFLSEIAAEGTMHIIPFDWSAAKQLPFLPRLRVGRSVLSPAEWHLPSDALPAGEASDSARWYAVVQEWRQTWNVPRYAYMTEVDNRLLLDLENPLCVADLGDECRKRAPIGRVVILQEMLPSFDEMWVHGPDGRYAVEFVVPLRKRQQTITPALPFTKRAPVPETERLRLPGSDWLYAKLYCGTIHHDDLLAGPIREFADEMLGRSLADRWFFIRYADPEPHIRLRFHGEPTVLLADLMPALTAWGQDLVDAGLVQRMAFDTYEREIERYGEVEGVQIAERIFAFDSRFVADVMMLLTQHALEITPKNLAVCTVDDLLAGLGLNLGARFDLYQTIRRGQERAFHHQIEQLRRGFHTYRKTAQRIIGDRSWLQEQPGGSDLQACLRQRSAALNPLGQQLRALAERNELSAPLTSLFASCVHMHCNRLIGVNRALEFEIMYYLECTLESLKRYVPNNINVL